MRAGFAAQKDEWKREHEQLLLEDGTDQPVSFKRTVAQSGTEGTMPYSGEAEVFDAYLENLRDNEHDPVACRRRAVYSSVFDPLKAHLERPKSPRRSEPLSLRRTPREAHTLVFGGER